MYVNASLWLGHLNYQIWKNSFSKVGSNFKWDFKEILCGEKLKEKFDFAEH